MHVIVIAPDKSVLIDGEPLELHNFEFDESLHAIQWNGENGHIEFETSDGGVSTAPVTELEVQPYVAAWQAEKARICSITPPKPTGTELNQERIIEIERQLAACDLASVRPLRAKLAGVGTKADEARLAELEKQAQALRAELTILAEQLNDME